ncbi:Frataxin mitochondrial [Spathaspora sp. JA1]|nr:Frataxin mitochondrial [Spathaspora sp. JA1]
MFACARCIGTRMAAPIARRGLVSSSTKLFMPKTVASTPLRQFNIIRNYSLSTQGEEIDNQIDDITANEYNKLSGEYLEEITDSLEELSQDFEQVDAELNHGVLTLILPPHGTYVINKQPPNKQIWLSSPISGPNRYDLIGGKWKTLRDGSSLTELLEEEVSSAVGTEFKFDIDS